MIFELFSLAQLENCFHFQEINNNKQTSDGRTMVSFVRQVQLAAAART